MNDKFKAAEYSRKIIEGTANSTKMKHTVDITQDDGRLSQSET